MFRLVIYNCATLGTIRPQSAERSGSNQAVMLMTITDRKSLAAGTVGELVALIEMQVNAVRYFPSSVPGASRSRRTMYLWGGKDARRRNN